MIQIREMRQGDARQITQLDQQIRGTDRSATWDQYVERVLAIINLESMQYVPWGCFVAVDDENPNPIIGFILSERQTSAYGLPPGVRVVALAVHPRYRMQGIGARLVVALEEKARSEDIATVFSVLLAQDERDAEFLEKCGFQSAGFRVFSKSI